MTESCQIELADPAPSGSWGLVVTDLAEGAEGHLLGWSLVYYPSPARQRAPRLRLGP